MAKFSGYRTVTVAAALLVYTIALGLGIELPEPNGEQALSVCAVLMFALRMITTGPVGDE